MPPHLGAAAGRFKTMSFSSFIWRREALKFGALALCAAALAPAHAQPAPPDPARADREHERPLRQHRRGGVPQPAVGGGARERARRRQAARRRAAAAARPLRQQGPERGGAVGAARRDGRRRAHRAAGQLVGHGRGADRCHREEQRARPVAARAVPQLLGGRPGAHQRALQLLALSLRRACRHARDGADGCAEGRRGAQARLPDRAGLQLRPGRAARVEAAARRSCGPTSRSSATSCIRWAA